MNAFGDFLESIKDAPIAESTERRAIKERRNAQIKNSMSKKTRSVDRRLVNRYEKENQIQRISKKPLRVNVLRRVVITGLGIVSPNGIGKQNFFNSIKESKSGIKPISSFDVSQFPSRFAGEIADDDLWPQFETELKKLSATSGININKARLLKRADRPVHLAMVAGIGAINDSGLELRKINKCNVGISVGTIMGGLGFALKELGKYQESGMHYVSPYTVAAGSPNPCSGELAAELGLRGPSITISSGCTSGANAINHAYQQIQLGKATVMLAGGTDSPLNEPLFVAFCRSGMLAFSNGHAVPPVPFDKDRSGIVLAEGSAMLVLEDMDHALARNADIYGEILSSTHTCDGYDMVKWRWHAQEATRAMTMAMEETELMPSDISIVFAHGTGSKEGDGMEMRAIYKAFKNWASTVPITNVKGLIGYSQGACSIIELAAACLALKHGVIPAVPNFNQSDKPLNISNKVRYLNINNALINCFGFGGKNACLLIGKP